MLFFSIQECFNACVSGCGYKFDIPSEVVNQVRPNRPSKPLIVSKPRTTTVKSTSTTEDIPCTSA